jgi:hypothetical protein
MATYKIALMYAQGNEQWKTLYERIRNSFEDATVELIAIHDTATAVHQLLSSGAELVLLDPGLVGLREALAKIVPAKNIILLNIDELGIVSLNMPGNEPRIPVYKIRYAVYNEFVALGLVGEDEFSLPEVEAEEPTRSGYEEAGEEMPMGRDLADLLDEDTLIFEPPESESTPPAPAPATPQAPPPPAPSAAPKPSFGTSPQEFLNPQFSAYYPTAVAPNQSYALMAFAHIESMAAAVREVAAGYQQMMGGQQSSATASSKVEVSKGTLLTLVPRVDGITFTPAEQIITWDGQPWYSATFLFQTLATLNADLSGRVLVFNGPLILGEIPVMMQIIQTDAGKALDKAEHLKKFDPIFASYSHRDTPVMQYFKRARENIGQKMLVDVYDLRSGEHWAQRLLDMIDESAVFQLFWSKHAAESQYCRQEWEHALQLLPQRERFIQPVWWSEPMPKPPPELQDLHFQRINLPTGTRWKIRLGNLFGG